MKKDYGLNSRLLEDFRNLRNQVIINMSDAKVTEQRKIKRGYYDGEKKKLAKPSYYEKYEMKLKKGLIDEFSTRDLLYFFKDTAEKAGIKYIENNQVVSMRNFKLCINKGYTAREVAVMIAFLFESDQSYLDKRKLTPQILNSKWVNTIYPDSQDWINDCYDPNSKSSKRKNATSKREWTDSTDATDTKIGEWE